MKAVTIVRYRPHIKRPNHQHDHTEKLNGAPGGDEGSIWSNKAFSNGVLNILRHALRVLSVQLLKANNASHFLLSASYGTAMMDLIN